MASETGVTGRPVRRIAAALLPLALLVVFVAGFL
jgi:hypothetical protein